MPRPKRAPPPPPDDDIALANSKSDADFLTSYLLPTYAPHTFSITQKLTPPSPSHPTTPWTPTFTHPTTSTPYTLTLTSTPPLPACLSLISLTSRLHYGPLWSPPKKLREMRTPGLRYVLIHPSSDPSHLAGFMSFLPTYEPYPVAVVYVYEVHLLPELRGGGLGRRLMRVCEEVAGRVRGVGKVMLTCFEENRGAMGFYRGEGFGVDGTCPSLLRKEEAVPGDGGVRKLRGGKVREEGPRYCILSKRVEGREGFVREEETGKPPRDKPETVEEPVEGSETWEDVEEETGEGAEEGTSKQDEGRSPERKRRRVVVDTVS